MTTATVRPNADGSVRGDHTGDYGDVYNDDGDSSYIYGPNTKISTFKFSAASIPSGTIIQSVKVYVTSKYVSGTGTHAPVVGQISGDVSDYQGSTSMSSSYGTNSYTWTTNPWESRNWTRADLDDLEIGVRTTTPLAAYEARCTEVYAVITYILATGGGGAQIIGLSDI